MFESVTVAPPDAILGLNEAFKHDPSPDKIDLTVGVYKDAQGMTPILGCVKAAEERLWKQEKSKSYLAIDGNPDYGGLVQTLLLGREHPIVAAGRIATLQTPGGTGAVRVAADFINRVLPSARIWCSEPTWPNHPNIFRAAGLEVKWYPYFDAASNALAFDAMIAGLRQIPSGDVVLLHPCCHNPTGVDPTLDQWRDIVQVISQQGLLPLLDFAYQGFCHGLEEDAAGVRQFCREGSELLVCNSFSKNFGLYNERVGALSVIAKSAETTQAALSQLKSCVRSNYSNPPAHGAAVVATVLGDDELRRQWERELSEMRDRINGVRELFAKSMRALSPSKDFSFIRQQRGMFSFSGMSADQADQLREKYSIYIVRNGRINVAGITEENVGRLCESICAVL